MIKRLFDFYIDASFHVSLSLTFLMLIVSKSLSITVDFFTVLTVFCLAFSGYNFIKFYHLFFKNNTSTLVKIVGFLTVLTSLFSLCVFFKVNSGLKILILVMGIHTLLYVFPFFYVKKVRLILGLKNHFVVFCWVLLTVFYPILYLGCSFFYEEILIGLQIYFFVFALLLIFEIVDLENDKGRVVTIPLLIGIRKTKLVTIIFTLLFLTFGLFTESSFLNKIVLVLVAIIVAFFTVFSSEKSSKYFSKFWVESIPIIWYIMLLLT